MSTNQLCYSVIVYFNFCNFEDKVERRKVLELNNNINFLLKACILVSQERRPNFSTERKLSKIEIDKKKTLIRRVTKDSANVCKTYDLS